MKKNKMFKWSDVHPVEYALMVMLMGFGAYLRLYDLSTWVMAADDVIHIIFANRKSAWEAITYTTQREVHPALSYLMLYLLINYVSPSMEVLRLIGIIPGLLLMPAMYVLGRVLIGRAAGIFLMGVTAFSHVCIIQTQNVRSYSMCQLFLVIGLLAAFYYLKERKAKWLWWYFGMMALALFSEYVAALPLAAVGITMMALLWLQSEKKITREQIYIALGHVALALFWAFQLYVYFNGRAEMPDNLHYVHKGFVSDLKSLAFVMESIQAGFLLVKQNPLYPVMVVVNMMGLFLMVLHRRWFLLSLILLSVLFGLLAAATSLYPLTNLRHAMWVLIFAILPFSYLAQYVWEGYRSVPIARAGFVVALFGLLLSNAFWVDKGFLKPDFYRAEGKKYELFIELEMHKQDFLAAMRFLQDHFQAEDWLVTSVSDNLRLYYYVLVNPIFEHFYKHRKITCHVWTIFHAQHYAFCLHNPLKAYEDETKPYLIKHKEKLLQSMATGKDFYLLSNTLEGIDKSSHPRDTKKPYFRSATVEAFVLRPEAREIIITPQAKDGASSK